jgi:hypothetical protein
VLRLVLLLVVVMAAAAVRAGAAPEREATAVVRECYAHHFATDMALTEASVRAKAPWLSADLLAACLAYLARPSPPDEVPSIDGDPFTDSQDYPRSFRVGRATLDGATGRVPVTLTWSRERRRVVAVVALVDGSWRITDLEYPDGRTLSAMLAAPK